MPKPDYPEILKTPMEDFDKELPSRIEALIKHYGANDFGGEEVDWARIAFGLAMDHVPGFQMVTGKKKGRPPTRLIKDIQLVVEMSKRIDAGMDIEPAAYDVFEKHLGLGKSGEAVRQRWMLLNRGGSEWERVAKMILRSTWAPDDPSQC